MRHLQLLICAALLGGLGLVLVTSRLAVETAAAQGGTENAYLGADECADCHRGLARDHADSLHSQALLPPNEDVSVADFSQGETLRTVLLPGESAARPFTLDDVATVIGAGRYSQRFAVTGEDGTLLVLPVEWNAVDGRWQDFTLADAWPDPAYDFGANCAYCHTTGLDAQALTWVDDGVQCEVCHGPAENHVTLADDLSRNASDEEVDTVRAAIYNEPDPQMCGQCHTRGTDTATGRPYPTTYQPGGDLLAGFTPAPADDTTHWWVSGHAAQPNMQYNEWLTSAHANSLQAVQDAANADNSCLTCHSGDYRYTEKIRGWFDEFDLDGTLPDSLTVQTATEGIACQTCHNPHSEEDNDFLLVDEPYALCADCHNTANYTGEGVHHPALEIYEGQQLVDEVAGMPSGHFSATRGPDCLTCHMPALPVSDGNAEEGARYSHALLPVPLDAPEPLDDVAACTACHVNVPPAQVAAMVTDVQANVSARLDSAQAALTSDSPDWVRVALDAVAGDGSRGLHNYGYTNALLSAAEAALVAEAAPAEEGTGGEDTAVSASAGEEGVLDEPEVIGPQFESIVLPIVGRVEGLTVVGATSGSLAFLVALFGGIALIVLTRDWRRFLGGGLLLVAVALLVIALLLIFPAREFAAASGDDAYCQVCHTTSAHPLQLADGESLRMAVDPSEITDSVHGEASPTGRMGCLDCHGADAFPHGNVPQNLRQYRIAMSNICADCHADSLEHYQTVRDRNILVGCADCHSAHDVQPADTIEILPEHVIEQILERRGLPSPTPAATPVAATPINPAATEAAPAALSGPLDYQTLQPILVAECGACHGDDSPRAGLNIITYADLMAGSRGGTVVEPGDPANSFIVEVQQEPHAANLSPDELQFLIDWIAAGAPEFAGEESTPAGTEAEPEATAEATEEATEAPTAEPTTAVEPTATEATPTEATEVSAAPVADVPVEGPLDYQNSPADLAGRVWGLPRRRQSARRAGPGHLRRHHRRGSRGAGRGTGRSGQQLHPGSPERAARCQPHLGAVAVPLRLDRRWRAGVRRRRVRVDACRRGHRRAHG